MTRAVVPQVQKSYAEQIASSFLPRILGSQLAEDVLHSVGAALGSNVAFGVFNEPEAILRQAVATAITDLEARVSQLHRFLRDGPYEGSGDIPPELQGRRLIDEETSKVVTFIYSHVVNCFQGCLAELLAAKPCAQLIQDLKASRQLTPSVREVE